MSISIFILSVSSTYYTPFLLNYFRVFSVFSVFRVTFFSSFSVPSASSAPSPFNFSRTLRALTFSVFSASTKMALRKSQSLMLLFCYIFNNKLSCILNSIDVSSFIVMSSIYSWSDASKVNIKTLRCTYASI